MNKNSLKIALIQSELSWENPVANRAHFSKRIKDLEPDVDLIVLPEMFSTGFSMTCSHLAEEMGGATVRWMLDVSAEKEAVLCGSVLVKAEQGFMNRLIWATPDGSLEYYDKRHLFTLANEQDHFRAGEERLIVEYKGWKICPLICYDLRFPVWSRNGWDVASGADYDVLIYVANWPERRSDAWKKLLAARAIENQCYVIGVNRVGKDGAGFAFSGDSQLIDPMGTVLLEFDPGLAHQKTRTIEYLDLMRVREKLPFLPDQDRFRIG